MTPIHGPKTERSSRRLFSEDIELRGWRLVGPQINALLERVLAAQGDKADGELVVLQNEVMELINLGK